MHKKFQTETHKNKLFYQKMNILGINIDMNYYVFKLGSDEAMYVVIMIQN